MITPKSLKNFVYVNSLIFSLGIFEHFAGFVFIDNFYLNFFSILFIFLARNYILVNFISFSLKNKENINSIMQNYKEVYKNEFLINLLSSTTVETFTYIIIKKTIYTEIQPIFYLDFVYFIPKSFIFEVIFDFFHYWSHRFLHTNKFFYKYIHKKHHKYSYPIPILTFYQNPFDLIITNSIPQLITLSIFPYISLFQFNIILSYKSFIEISGHSSKKLYPSGSFSQFVWLPRVFNISLYTEDHTLHHSNNNCNYSKRFSLWDKAFGTYK
jgi:sphinganine C4-monooxygenase